MVPQLRQDGPRAALRIAGRTAGPVRSVDRISREGITEKKITGEPASVQNEKQFGSLFPDCAVGMVPPLVIFTTCLPGVRPNPVSARSSVHAKCAGLKPSTSPQPLLGMDAQCPWQ